MYIYISFRENIIFRSRAKFDMLKCNVFTKVLVLLALFAVPSFGETTVASTPISTPPPATVPKVINDNLSDCQKVSEWPEISRCALLLARTYPKMLWAQNSSTLHSAPSVCVLFQGYQVHSRTSFCTVRGTETRRLHLYVVGEPEHEYAAHILR